MNENIINARSAAFHKKVDRDGRFILLTPYTASNEKVRAVCKECGCERNVEAKDLIRRRCPNCYRKAKKHEKIKAGGIKYIKRIEELYPIEVIGRYSGSREPLRIRFKFCGHERDILVDEALFCNREPICRTCLKERKNEIEKIKREEQRIKKEKRFLDRKRTVLMAINNMSDTFETLNIKEDYTSVLLRCKKCGFETVRTHNDMSKPILYGCKICSKRGDSEGIKTLVSFL